MANMFQWDESLDLGIREMNAEHQRLISIMNRLQDEYVAGASRDVLKRSLEELQAYTLKHFQDEEAYMQSVDYPKLETHKLIHAELLRKFTDHVDSFRRENTLPPAFFDFLQFWLGAHIRGIDRQYADYASKAACA